MSAPVTGNGHFIQVDSDPTPREIRRLCQQIREDGWTDRYGVFHEPWPAYRFEGSGEGGGEGWEFPVIDTRATFGSAFEMLAAW
jgi:hypothetical protein